MKNNMKIWVYTFCYNEMKILPCVINYWKEYADKVIVYDNGSDDGSKEYLSQFDWIEVRPYVTDGFNDLCNKEMKNSMWKEARQYNVDYVIVCDTDEVLYTENGVRNELINYLNNNISVVETDWCNLITKDYPYTISNSNEFIHKEPNMFGHTNLKDKTLIFNPNIVKESNYSPGAHTANFVGDIKVNQEHTITVYHLDKMGLDYFLDKQHQRCKRLSKTNIVNGYGIHYRYSDDRIINDFIKELNSAQKITNKNTHDNNN